MDITITSNPDAPATALSLAGRFDAHEAPAFRSTIDRLIEASQTKLRVDLAAVEFVDSAGLAELVRAMKRCREVGGDVALRSPSKPVRVILELTRLDTAFVIV